MPSRLPTSLAVVPEIMFTEHGIGTYTMSTLANRLTGAPVDEQLREFA